jgi:hypothetical protein
MTKAKAKLAKMMSGGALSCDPPAKVAFEYSPKPEVQERTFWCWAATGRLMMNIVRPGSVDSQCKEANRVFGLDVPGHTNDCCDPSSCNLRGKPPYEKYGFSIQTVSTDQNQLPLSWDQIRDQLGCKGKPVAVVWRRNDGSQGSQGSQQMATKHMAVIVGYRTDDQGVAFVLLNDPEEGTLTPMTFEAYLGGDLSTHERQVVSNDYDLTFTGP